MSVFGPQDEYSILNSKHFIGIHGYMIVYSVASKQTFEMARIIRDKILNHLVRDDPKRHHSTPQRHNLLLGFPCLGGAAAFHPLGVMGSGADSGRVRSS